MRPQLLWSALVGLAYALQNQIIVQDDIVAADIIHDELVTSAIIPEVLDDFEPLVSLYLLYPGYESVSLGNNIPAKHVSQRPIFTLTKLQSYEQKPNTTYTLVLTDPDARSRDNPKWSEMCHWILTALPTPSTQNDGIRTMDVPDELIDYLAPAPPKRTGPHRYVFVLVKGNSTSIETPKKRKHWGYNKIRHGVRDWAAENELRVIGANFFYAQHKTQ